MVQQNPAQFAYYIYTVEEGACPECESLDGTMFLAEHLKEFEAKTGVCPAGCFAAIMAVYADEQGALATARQIRLVGGILKS